MAKKVSYILCACIIVLAALYHLGAVTSLHKIELARAQLIIFPLLFLIAATIKIFSVRVPAAVLLFIALGASGALSYSYLHIGDRAKSFIVAKLDGDEFEIASRALRENINAELRVMTQSRAVRAQRYHDSFSKQRDVEQFLSETSHIPMVVWGNNRFLIVSTHPDRVKLIESNDIEPWLSITGLRFITSVPAFGISTDPPSDTAHFIASIATAFLDRTKNNSSFSEVAKSLRLSAAREQSLLDSALLRAPWASFAPRAFSFFHLGNYYLAKAVAHGRYDAGEMECAIDAYTRGRMILRYADNPELLAALLNNRAIAHSIQIEVTGRYDLKPLVKRELTLAAETLKHKNLLHVKYSAGKIARANLKRIEKIYLKKMREGRKPRAAL